MSIVELLLIAVGLSMDAFAVAICKGLALKKVRFLDTLTVGFYFGIFQAIMPLIGFYAGRAFAGPIEAFDHWVAFALLGFIGGRMIVSSIKKDKSSQEDCAASLSFQKMLPLALATSIDALAVGISFAFLKVGRLPAAGMIGVTTLLLSMAGVKIGNAFGKRYKFAAELIGGLLLIAIGVNILLEHLIGL